LAADHAAGRGVRLGTCALAASGWFYDGTAKWLWIKLPISAATIRADIGG